MPKRPSILLLIPFLFSACANVVTPGGGPKDMSPPQLIKAKPANRTINFNASKISLEFDEYFTLKNIDKQLIVAPAQKNKPEIRIKKKTIYLQFPDSLEKNTTYTLAFGNSICDVNEGNVASGFNYVFSTGPYIDSLSISGTVLNAETMEPEKNISVFLYQSTDDSVIYTAPPYIYSTTLENGAFSIKNLKQGTYKLVALKDLNNNLKYDPKNESLAFPDQPIQLTADLSKITLPLFKESPGKTHITSKELNKNYHIALAFNKPDTSIATNILFPPEYDSRKREEWNKQGDSLKIWLPGQIIDSVKLSVKTATSCDTFLLRPLKSKKAETSPSLSISTNLVGGTLKPAEHLRVYFSQPLLYVKPDSLVLTEDSIPLKISCSFIDSLKRELVINYPFKDEKVYVLHLKDSFCQSITNQYSPQYKSSFLVNGIENYGNLSISLALNPGNYIAQLLTPTGTVISSATINADYKLVYTNLLPQKYRFRLINDANKNGVWDTGNYLLNQQPEKITYFPDEINLRANWDMDLVFDLSKPTN